MSRKPIAVPDRPRPRTGRLCLDLVATVRGRFGASTEDGLANEVGVSRWLSDLGLQSVPPPDPAGAELLRRLREAIFRLATYVAGVGDGDPASPTDLALVNETAAGPVVVSRLAPAEDGSAGLTAQRPTPTFDQVLALIARDAVDLLGGPEAARLHQCQAEVCGSFYLDTSRGGLRRWCSSASCGNRMRVQT